jgi:hypothetical protein
MLDKNNLFGNPLQDGFPYLKDVEYTQTLEQMREQLEQNRPCVLARCKELAEYGATKERGSKRLAPLRAFFSEQELLLSSIKGEVSRIHWDSGSLFRQALSQDEKRTVCRILVHLEHLERSFQQMLGQMDALEQALREEARASDSTLLFLRTVLPCAEDDLEISSLCNSAIPQWNQLRQERLSLLTCLEKGREQLAPILRKQLPYACEQILKHADLDEGEGGGNVRALVSLLSSLDEALTCAMARCGELLLLSTEKR